MNLKRKPKIGLILIGAKRFRPLGAGTERGAYEVRKTAEADSFVERFSEFSEVVFPGIVYEREEAEAAARSFYNDKVDCAVAIFLSWAEDFAWIRFLRELPELPLMLASVVRDSLSITDTNDEDQFVDFLSAGALVGFQVASGSFSRFNRPMSDICVGTLDKSLLGCGCCYCREGALDFARFPRLTARLIQRAMWVLMSTLQRLYENRPRTAFFVGHGAGQRDSLNRR